MNRPYLPSMIALLAAWTLGSGCAAGTGASDERPASDRPTTPPTQPPVMQSQTRSAPVSIDQAVPEKPVWEGTAPKVYLLPSAGSVRIVDKTAGRDLVTTTAAARAIIRIDASSGISMGKETLLAGPLPAGHEYAIYLSTGSGSDVQRTITGPSQR